MPEEQPERQEFSSTPCANTNRKLPYPHTQVLEEQAALERRMDELRRQQAALASARGIPGLGPNAVPTAPPGEGRGVAYRLERAGVAGQQGIRALGPDAVPTAPPDEGMQGAHCVALQGFA